MQELFLKVYGRVQGVFFRTTTCDMAYSLGLTGWVRNADDGTVEILAQGEIEKLKQLEKLVHTCASFSQVEKVEASYRKITQKFNNFKINYS